MPLSRLTLTLPRIELSADAATETEEEPTYPTEQLGLIHDEVDRQRTAIAARRTSMHTRAAVLVTASGILASIQSTSWVSGWQFVSIILSVAAAGIGLWAMRPVTGPESDPKVLFEHRLSSNPYVIERRIVEDNLTALEGEKAGLGKIATTLTVGYIILLVMWASMVVIAALDAANVI